MSFALIKEMLATKLGAAPLERDTLGPLADIHTHLAHLRIGGVLDFKQAAGTFIMLDAAGSLFKAPADASVTVDTHGKISDAGCWLHRFHFGDYFLQCVVAGGGLDQTQLYIKLTEINPASEEEWRSWLDEDSLLTGKTIDWAKPGTEEQITYARSWMPNTTRVQPRLHEEYFSSGGPCVIVKSSSMRFQRALSGGLTEYLYLAVCRHGDTRWVEAHVGVDIPPLEVVAI